MQDLNRRNRRLVDTPSALAIVSEYAAAVMARDSDRMDSLRSPDFVQDLVAGDAFEDEVRSDQETTRFWTAWFGGFSEMDYEVTRTIAAADVVVMQWVFTGTHTGPLQPSVFGRRVEPTGRTIQLRGVSVYDVREGLIQRETMYMDLATVMVELGMTW